MYINRMDEILCDSEVGSANEIRVVGQPLIYNELYAVSLALTGNQYRNDYKRFSAWVRKRFAYLYSRAGGE